MKKGNKEKDKEKNSSPTPLSLTGIGNINANSVIINNLSMNYCGTDKLIPNHQHYIMDPNQHYSNNEGGFINNYGNSTTNFDPISSFNNSSNSNLNLVNGLGMGIGMGNMGNSNGNNDVIINNYNINKQDSFGKNYPLNQNIIPNMNYYPIYDNFNNGNNYLGNPSNYQVLSSSTVTKKTDENFKKK